MNIKTRKTKNRGFTLIEILVATAIFGLLILITTGIFLGIVSAQRKAAATRVLQDSVRFAIEAMSRDIRTGYDFSGFDNCRPHYTSGGYLGTICRELRFTSTIGSGGNICYRFENGAVRKGNVTAAGCSSPLPLTPDNLRVERLNFLLSQTTPPLITITLGAAAGQGQNETRINIQSTVSQRSLRP